MEKKSFIEELKQQNDIVEVGKELISGLEKVGALFVGTVRNESTPALTIYPPTQSWCHFAGDTTPSGKKGGDVINLIEYINNCSSTESIAFLAKRVGMETKGMTSEQQTQWEENKKNEEQDQLILEKLVSVFEQRREKAIEYLGTRSINNHNLITFYHIGWANHSIEDLKKELTAFDKNIVGGILSNPYFFKNSLIIPVYQNGKIVTL